MKLSIYNVYVPIEDQTQADRMKQICIDYGLPCSNDFYDFLYNKNWGNSFYYSQSKKFGNCFRVLYFSDKTQVTESEFLELVKINFANSK